MVCPQISSNIAGYIRNKFKPLAVDNVNSKQHIASDAQLTLSMHQQRPNCHSMMKALPMVYV